jgi:hypothetical protein
VYPGERRKRKMRRPEDGAEEGVDTSGTILPVRFFIQLLLLQVEVRCTRLR